MGSHSGSNGNPLDPPLFWLDNTFIVEMYDDLSIISKLNYCLIPKNPS
jgi:hypothetical protein